MLTHAHLDRAILTVEGARPFKWTARDGLPLSAHLWGNQSERLYPVLCLPGLTRNTRDFYRLACRLHAAGHHVIAMDYRGRGLSGYANDPTTYNMAQEAQDIEDGLSALGIERYVVLGTSRGGLHGVGLAATQPDRVRAVILNDIGPELAHDHLKVISETIGRHMTASSWPQAAARLKAQQQKTFTAMTEQDWLDAAAQTYEETAEGVRLSYDPNLRHAVKDAVLPTPQALWSFFDALKGKPHLLIRGANSPLLSEKTANAMQERHPEMDLHTVAFEGHAPLLWGTAVQERILRFLQTVNEETAPPASADKAPPNKKEGPVSRPL